MKLSLEVLSSTLRERATALPIFDPTSFLDINRKDDGNNDRKYNSSEFESLMARADAETDRGARMGLLSQAERLIVEEDLPILPILDVPLGKEELLADLRYQPSGD